MGIICLFLVSRDTVTSGGHEPTWVWSEAVCSSGAVMPCNKYIQITALVFGFGRFWPCPANNFSTTYGTTETQWPFPAQASVPQIFLSGICWGFSGSQWIGDAVEKWKSTGWIELKLCQHYDAKLSQLMVVLAMVMQFIPIKIPTCGGCSFGSTIVREPFKASQMHPKKECPTKLPRRRWFHSSRHTGVMLLKLLWLGSTVATASNRSEGQVTMSSGGCSMLYHPVDIWGGS